MAFDVFDRDKNGGISHEELKYILGEYNPNAREYLWKKMIQQIDLNQDGQISYEEFHKMMMDVIKNKNKRFSMQSPTYNNYINNTNTNYITVFNSSKQNATAFDSKKLIDDIKSDGPNLKENLSRVNEAKNNNLKNSEYG